MKLNIYNFGFNKSVKGDISRITKASHEYSTVLDTGSFKLKKDKVSFIGEIMFSITNSSLWTVKLLG